MTVTNTSSKQAAQAMDGVATQFFFTFQALPEKPEGILASIVDTTTDIQTDLIYNDGGVDGYTVSVDDDGDGGSITVNDARSADYELTIFREYEELQETNYADYNAFPAETVEDNQDLLTFITQQLSETLSRAMVLPITVTGVDTTLPVPEAGAPIGWNDTADGLTNNPDLINQVQIDTAANPDYIGAGAGDGVLRTGAGITYTDGGDFVTLTADPSTIDHDALLNFVALEHIDHSAVSVIAGTGLSGGGTIQTDRTLDVSADYAVITANDGATDVTAVELETLTDGSNADALHVHASITNDQVKVDAAATRDYIGATAADGVIRAGSSIAVADGGDFITLTVSEGNVDHDSLLNYVANDHVDHSTVDIATAVNTSGLAGGGDITATRNLVVDIPNTTAGTVASLDEVLIADVDDADNLKRVTAQSIADLGAGGGAVAIEDEGVPLTAAVSLIDFVGAGVTATNVGSVVTVTIPGGGGGATLELDVTQGNAFSVGEWIYHNGTIYVLADASAPGTAESIGVVTAATGADFTVQFGGRITGLSGLTAGEAHFLSETAGAITATAPSTEGAVIKPVLIADSTTTGFIFNMRGIGVTSTTSFYQTFQNAAGLTPQFTHNLGHKYCIVQVYDNNDDLIQPDDITLDDNDNLTVDLTSYGTRTGDWNVVILDIGTTATNGSTLQSAFDNGRTISNSSTATGITLTQAAALAASQWAFYLYTSVNQVNGAELFRVWNNGTGSTDNAAQIRNDGTGSTLLLTNASSTQLATGKHLLHVTDGAGVAHTNADSAFVKIQSDHAGTTEPALEIAQTGSGPALQMNAPMINSGQPAFCVGCELMTNLIVGTTTIKFSNARFNRGSHFNTGTYTFTAPVTGLYKFDVMFMLYQVDSSATYFDLNLETTAKRYWTRLDPNGLDQDLTLGFPLHINILADMTAADTAYVTYFQSGGAAQSDTAVNESWFSGFLVA